MKRRHLITAAALSAATIATTSTWAQSGPYPNRPIKMIVPYAAGISPDIVARLIGDKLGQARGQPVVIDNRPGAGSMPAGVPEVNLAVLRHARVEMGDEPKIGRNDACYCGSGKKFKKCHGGAKP